MERDIRYFPSNGSDRRWAICDCDGPLYWFSSKADAEYFLSNGKRAKGHQESAERKQP